MHVSELIALLNEATSSPLLNYESAKNISTCGLYIVYKGNKALYVGKTDRTGKIRFREMTSDYRSHTLNRKLLHKMLTEFLKSPIGTLKKESKHQFISAGSITENDFTEIQQKINMQIKTELKFRFLSIEGKNLTRLEHFAIAVLNPEMND